MFSDNQIWENEKYAMKVERMMDPSVADSAPTVRAVIFVKTEGGLRFLEFVWKDEKYLERLVKTTGMTPTDKKIVLE
jgi:hypothetical protein